jgi:hypothetical protein
MMLKVQGGGDTYTDGLANQLWELPSIHLPSWREVCVTTDLALEVEL